MTENLYLHPQADELSIGLDNRRQLARFLADGPQPLTDRDAVTLTVVVLAGMALGWLVGRWVR